MASPYTQNIEQSKVYKRATGEDRNILDDVLDISQELKEKANNKLAENIQRLKEENVFELQNQKAYLTNLNKFTETLSDIDKTYNGNRRAWAQATAKKRIDAEILNSFEDSEVERNNLKVKYPNAAMGKLLDTRTSEIEEELNKTIRMYERPVTDDYTLRGISALEEDQQKTYIEDLYNNAFKQLGEDTKQNVISVVGNIFQGKGLGVANAKTLKKEINDNMAVSQFSGLRDFDKQIRALYSASPNLVAEIEDIMIDKNTGEMKPSWKNAVYQDRVRIEITEGPESDIPKVFTQEGMRLNERGQRVERDYTKVILKETDRFGRTKRTEILEPVVGSVRELRPTLTQPERQAAMLLSTDEGDKMLYSLFEDGFSVDKALATLQGVDNANSDDPTYKNLLLTADELEQEDVRNKILNDTENNFEKYKEANYFREEPISSFNTVKQKILRQDIADYKSGKTISGVRAPRPADYFENAKDFMNWRYKNYIEFAQPELGRTKEDMGISLSTELFDNPRYEQFAQDPVEQLNVINNILKISDKKIIDETQRYNSNIYDGTETYNTDGNIFNPLGLTKEARILSGQILIPEREKEILNQKGYNTDLVVTLKDYGMSGEDSYEFGYSLKDQKLILQNSNLTDTEFANKKRDTNIDEVINTDEDDSWFSWGTAINAAMFAGGAYSVGPKASRFLGVKAIQQVGAQLVKKVTVKKAKNLKTQMDSILFNKKDLFGSPPIRKFANTEKGKLAEAKYIKKWQQKEISNLDPSTIRKTILDSPWFKSLNLESKTIVKASLDNKTKYTYNAPINIGTKAFRNSLGKEALTVQYGKEAFRQVAPKTTKGLEFAAKNKKTIGGGLLMGGAGSNYLYRRAFEDSPEEK